MLAINQPDAGGLGMYVDLMTFQFTLRKRRTEMRRIGLFQDVAAFYYQEKEEMERVLQNYWLNKPFSKETIDNMLFTHEDVLQKVIGRKTAGIFTQLPVVSMVDKKGTVSPAATEQLNALMEKDKFWYAIKDAFRKSVYFNCSLIQPIFRDNRIEFDVITGEEAAVNPKKDYYTINQIKLARIDEKGFFYFVYWSDEGHFIVDITGTRQPIDGNPGGVNPYGIVPMSVLRRFKGRTFWGDPNWALFFYQLAYTMQLSDDERATFFHKFPIMWGVNTGIADRRILKPGDFFDFDKRDPNMPDPEMKLLDFKVNWDQLDNHLKAKRESTMVNQGIPASSASSTPRNLSGAAKTIDELELEEQRIEATALLYDFVMDTLKIYRTVNNYNMQDKIPEDLDFDVIFSEETPHETIADKVARRQMELQYGIKTPIDFISEDLEVSADEAKQIYTDNMTTNQELGVQTSPNVSTGASAGGSILKTILNTKQMTGQPTNQMKNANESGNIPPGGAQKFNPTGNAD